jgi:ribosomal protein S18 acetylase RimI-like enzyme
MPTFRKLKISDKKPVLDLLKQLTDSKINFNIKSILKDSHCTCLVLEEKKSVIGFGALVTYLVPCRGYIARIEDVVIDVNYRGNGLGRKMTEELIKIAKKKKIKIINLTSRPKRIEARRLYESMGFMMLETRIFKLEL